MTEIDVIERIIHFPISRSRVWRAITTPTGLCGWFSDRAEFTAEVGSPMKLEWDEYETVPGIVERVEPEHAFAFRWQTHGGRNIEQLTPLNSTLITFMLEDEADGTKLTLCERGFASLAPELHGVARPEHESGWDTELAELTDYLAR